MVGAHSELGAALSALSDARTSMVGAHSELGDVQLRLGIRTTMTVEDKAEPTTAELRDVA